MERESIELARRLGPSRRRTHIARQRRRGRAADRRVGLGDRGDRRGPPAGHRRSSRADASTASWRSSRSSAVDSRMPSSASLVERLRALDDVDVAASDPRPGRVRRPVRSATSGSRPCHWMQVAELSDLNRPYALPRAGNAAVLAGDVAAARAALDATRRPRDARAGHGRRPRRHPRPASPRWMATGRRADALPDCAISAWPTLGLPWDEALTDARVPSRGSAPMPRACGNGSRTPAPSTERLEAAPMLVLLDAATWHGSGPVGRRLGASRRVVDRSRAAQAARSEPDPTA